MTSQSDNHSSISFVPLAGVLTTLYLSQGLPGGLIAHALPAYLRAEGVSLALIGSLKLLALPWLLKFLWAPFVEGNGSFGRKVNWIFAMQSIAAVSLLGLSIFVTQTGTAFLVLSLLCLLLMNLSSSTQDIATDGIAASQTPKNRLGIVNSIQVAGYKVGMLIGGSGLLLASEYVPLTDLMVYLAIFLLLLLLPLVWYQRVYKVSLGAQELSESSGTQSSSFWQTYRGFIVQPVIKTWILVLLTYKLADSFGSAMLKPMLVDKGVALSVIGEITLYSSLFGLAAALAAGWLYKRWGASNCLMIFCVLQGLSVSSFYFIAASELSLSSIHMLVVIEQICDGLSTVVLFAVMMMHCRKGHEGADYTLQASLQIVLAGVLGAISGVVANSVGYEILYGLCAVFGVLSLVFVLAYKQHQTINVSA